MEVSQVIKAGIRGSIAHPESAELVIDLLETDIATEADLTEYVKKDGSTSSDKLNLDTTPTLGTLVAGDIYYDESTKTIAAKVTDNTTLRLSQDDSFIAHNNSFATIPKGKVVYVIGVIDSQPRIGLARADTITITSILGITSEDIPHGSKGLVITRGILSGLDSDEFFTNSTVYLSDTVAGELQQAPPLAEYSLTVQIGYVLVSNATTGSYFIELSKNNKITDLADVEITTPIVDQVLRYNGAYWINGSETSTSASVGANFFLDSSPAIPAGSGPQSVEVFSLIKNPSPAGESILSAVVNNNTQLIKMFNYESSLGGSSIDSGVWRFNTHALVSQTVGVSTLPIVVRKVSAQPGTITIMGIGTSRTATANGATPFFPSDYNADLTLASYIQTPNALFRITGYISNISVNVETVPTYTNEITVGYSKHINLFVDTPVELNNTTLDLFASETTRDSFPIDPSDKLSVAYYARTTAVINTTVSLYINGVDNASYFITPIATRHNDLIGVQGGSSTELYHMTLAEYNVVLNTSGINTGDQDLSTFEVSANKSTSLTTDQGSDIKYPSVKSVFDYVTDTFQLDLGFTPENLANKATTLASPDNTKYPTTQAVATAIGALAPGGVTSFNTRTGAIMPVSGDYSKTDVGLSFVDNTSDINKPVSTAQADAIDVVQDDLTTHKGTYTNPHNTTKAQVGLGNVLNVDTTTTANITDSTDKRFITDTVLASIANKLDNNDPLLSTENELRVKLNPGTGEFSSIAAAAATITTSSITNPFVIRVGPGEYTEPVINLPEYVSVVGESIQTTIVKTATDTQHLFVLSTGCELSFMTMIGQLGANKAAIYIANAENFTQTHKVSIYDFDIGIHHIATTADSYLYVEYTDINGNYTNAVKAESSSGFSNRTQLENFYTYESTTSGAISILGTGTNLELQLFAIKSFCESTQKAIVVSNGVNLRINGADIQGASVGIEVLNVGSGCVIATLAAAFKNNTLDYNISHPNTSGSIFGGSSKDKIIIDSSAQVSVLILDTINKGILLNGPIYYSEDTYADLTDISELIVNTPTMGKIYGGDLSVSSGLILAISTGFGYSMSGIEPTHILDKKEWGSSTLLLSDNTSEFVYLNGAGTFVSNITEPNTRENILLGKVTTINGAIVYIEQTPINAHHIGNALSKNARQALGPIFVSGSLVSESGTRQLDATAGHYNFGELSFASAGGTAIAFDTFYESTTPGVYVRTAAQSTVSNSQYDNGSGTLASIPSLLYTKHLLVMVGGPSEKYLLIYGTATYATLLEAENAPLPTSPSFITNSFVKISSIIVRQGSSAIQGIIDERPRIGFASSSVVGGVSSHSDLSNLSADDHTQYLLVNGGRAMSGALDMGTNNITNVGTVDGVDITTHASRHLPNGADPIATGTPSTIGTTNAEGIANALARQDHNHSHGSQTDASHHAVATITDNGFMSSTDKTKLNGIATGATANASDSALRDRATHTGTQLAATISDFNATASAAAPVQSVAGKTGVVTLVKVDVGLSNVVNTDTTTTANITDSLNKRFATDAQLSALASIGQYFETVSKNLKSYPYALNYTTGTLTSIVYDIGGGNFITKTLNYTTGTLTSIVLSGTLPVDVTLVTKTLTYSSGTLTSVSYS
jgi:hypothetical protein